MIKKRPKIMSAAPARICLYGDHQDYLGLPVITTAINKKIILEAEENHSNYLKILTPDIGERRKIWLDDDFSDFASTDHYKSSLYVLRKLGYDINQGYTITISGDIPINAGLSSSSAIVVAWVQFLLRTFGDDTFVDSETISQLSYEAEVEVHGAPGGKMDQYAIGIGKVLYIDTGKNFKVEKLSSKLPVLIIGESGIPKNTIGMLGKLRAGALESIQQVKRKFPAFDIRNMDKTRFSEYMKVVDALNKNYFEAAVLNLQLTKDAYAELKKTRPDPLELGRLMNVHHDALKNLLGITVPRIDDMIEAAINGGAYGAKIVGSGGGGCIVAFVSEKNKQQVIDSIKNAGAIHAYEVGIAEGAHYEKID